MPRLASAAARKGNPSWMIPTCCHLAGPCYASDYVNSLSSVLEDFYRVILGNGRTKGCELLSDRLLQSLANLSLTFMVKLLDLGSGMEFPPRRSSKELLGIFCLSP